MGTFADRASRTHVKNITRQKKVVFGDRPTEISAATLRLNFEIGEESLKSGSLLSQSKLNGSQSQTKEGATVS